MAIKRITRSFSISEKLYTRSVRAANTMGLNLSAYVCIALKEKADRDNILDNHQLEDLKTKAEAFERFVGSETGVGKFMLKKVKKEK